jgi:hypothetical protein
MSEIQIMLAVGTILGLIAVLGVLGWAGRKGADPSCSVLGHRWKQYDKYYNTSNGADAVILCDQCERCGRRSRLVGGRPLLWPVRLYDDEPTAATSTGSPPAPDPPRP